MALPRIWVIVLSSAVFAVAVGEAQLDERAWLHECSQRLSVIEEQLLRADPQLAGPLRDQVQLLRITVHRASARTNVRFDEVIEWQIESIEKWASKLPQRTPRKGARTRGSISGTVTRFSDGSLVEGAEVQIIPIIDGQPGATVITTADGKFYSGVLGPGSFRIFIDPPPPLAAEHYDARSCSVAQCGYGLPAIINVELNQDLGSIEVVLELTAQISGTVRSASTGEALEDVYVKAHLDDMPYQNYWEGTRSVQTDADGRFSLLVPANEYRLYADPPTDSGLRSLAWPGLDCHTNCVDDGEIIVLEPGDLVENLDFDLPAGAQLEVQLQGSSGGAVKVRDVLGHYYFSPTSPAQWDNLTPGEYSVWVDPQPGRFGSIYPGIPLTGDGDPAPHGQTVQVSEQQLTTVVLDIESIEPIAGQLDAASLPSASVEAWSLSSTRIGTAPAAADGSFSLELDSSEPTVLIGTVEGALSEFWEDVDCGRHGCAPSSRGRIVGSSDFPVLGLWEATGSIAGTVLDPGGQPLSTSVDLFDQDGWRVGLDYVSDGNYEFDGLAPGEYFVVALATPDGLGRIFGGEELGITQSPNLDGASPVTVLPMQTTVADFVLASGPSELRGTVLDSETGQPIGSAWVGLWPEESIQRSRFTFLTSRAYMQSSELGEFSFTSVKPGRYVLSVSAWGSPRTIYPDTVCPNSEDLCDWGQAELIEIIEGQMTTVDVEIDPIRQGDGSSETPYEMTEGIDYQFQFDQAPELVWPLDFDPFSIDPCYLWMTYEAIESGYVVLGADGPKIFAAFRENAPSFDDILERSQPNPGVAVTAGERYRILAAGNCGGATIITIYRAHRFKGSLRSSDSGKPIRARADCPQFPYYWRWSALNDGNGQFELFCVFGASALVDSESSLYASAWLDPDDQEQVVELQRAAIFEGQVSLAGQGVSGIPISVLDLSGATIGETESGAYGRWAIGGLPGGRYVVRAEKNRYWQPSSFVSMLHPVLCPGALCDLATATAIDVAAGERVDGIDFSLQLSAQVSGLVRNAENGAIYGWVDVLKADGTIVGSQFTGGLFTITGLPPGLLYVRTRNIEGYLDEIWGDIPCPGGWCDPTLGTPVDVVATQWSDGIDFVLGTGGALNGVVTAEGSGAPIVQAEVQAWLADGQAVGFPVYTGADGSYRISGFSTAEVFVRVENASGFIEEIYDGGSCNNGRCDPTIGTPVTVSPSGTVSGIDFALRPHPGGCDADGDGDVREEDLEALISNLFGFALVQDCTGDGAIDAADLAITIRDINAS